MGQERGGLLLKKSCLKVMREKGIAYPSEQMLAQTDFRPLVNIYTLKDNNV